MIVVFVKNIFWWVDFLESMNFEIYFVNVAKCDRVLFFLEGVFL